MAPEQVVLIPSEIKRLLTPNVIDLDGFPDQLVPRFLDDKLGTWGFGEGSERGAPWPGRCLYPCYSCYLCYTTSPNTLKTAEIRAFAPVCEVVEICYRRCYRAATLGRRGRVQHRSDVEWGEIKRGH
ncbi:hypothetical protein FHS99_000753 [Sphingomonas prati]|uniref:Uncharacterized protein n=1 Tax=Sphingomonas prati TaxID=1843237 RepID=A0A7W9F0J3_9SPHN|nr:hypothetical protein [Sphingomonas prati]MBB5728283.1 hypothetical protein [Sphingomonas prati]